MSRWITEIAANTQAFSVAFGGLSADALNWKPSPEQWSIAQNIEHLIKINESFLVQAEKLRNGQQQLPWYASFGFTGTWMGKMLLKSVQPETRKKVKTFPIWHPTESSIPAAILPQFVQQQHRLKKLIEESSELLSDKAMIASPASRFIFYRLDVAFDILVSHEQRHLLQAKQVLNLFNGKNVAVPNQAS